MASDRIGAQPPGELIAVDVGQADVEDEDLRPDLRHGGQGQADAQAALGAVRGGLGLHEELEHLGSRRLSMPMPLSLTPIFTRQSPACGVMLVASGLSGSSGKASKT